MTGSAYIKVLNRKLSKKQSQLKILSQRKYNPFSYSSYRAYYLHEEIKLIKKIIKDAEDVETRYKWHKNNKISK